MTITVSPSNAPAQKSTDRLVVRFDPETLTFWPGDAKRLGTRNTLPLTVLHYKEDPTSRTPTGGRFTSRRMTVRDRRTGWLWVGQTRKDSDVVTLRPAPAPKK